MVRLPGFVMNPGTGPRSVESLHSKYYMCRISSAERFLWVLQNPQRLKVPSTVCTSRSMVPDFAAAKPPTRWPFIAHLTNCGVVTWISHRSVAGSFCLPLG
jgi:hypothetical protein